MRRIIRGQGCVLPSLGGIGPIDAARHDHDGRKVAWVGLGYLPGAVSAHGETGEVGTLRIAVELLSLSRKRSHCHVHHLGIGPPVMIKRDLWHHYDERPAIGMRANCGGKADLCLIRTIRSALAAAVEKKDHRPMFRGRPLFRNVDLVFVGGSLDGDMPIQKSGVVGACLPRSREKKSRDNEEEAPERRAPLHDKRIQRNREKAVS